MPVSDILLTMPAVALRGLVMFPQMLLHFEVGRKQSIKALDEAMAKGRKVFLVAQKDISVDEPKKDDLYKTGVIAVVKQIIKLPHNENVRVVVEGEGRALIKDVEYKDGYLLSTVKLCKQQKIKSQDTMYAQALIRHAKDVFDEYADAVPKLSPDVSMAIYSSENAGDLADYIAFNMMLEYQDRQIILDELNPLKRLEALCAMLTKESRLMEIESDIQEKVNAQIDKNQRDYYLREQLKAISEELNEYDNPQEEADEYIKKIEALEINEEIKEKFIKESKRLYKMSAGSSEAAVVRTYLDTCLALPWGKYSKDNLDIKKARKILDDDHYGMEKVKERIIEFLAVRKLAPDVKGQIICLYGPPGVGKTSIARSVARAMGREYRRVSLGGIHDEAEIRGHRKTYIGAMPGRIINAVKLAGTANPLILLDEVDKLGNDYKGDPSAALLEALDAEQNFEFRDHYIEVPFDLSKVVFITTANDTSTIPAPLLDRMEIIELPSYTQQDKLNIAKKHLVPKQRKLHGLKANNFKITDAAINEIIDGYTREAGVRKLEQKIAKICRKAAVEIADSQTEKVTVKPCDLEKMLGVAKYKDENNFKNEVGVATGLAWTSVGGETMPIEVAILDGKGEIQLTGSLGDVMKESAMAAISFIRSQADKLDIDKNFYKEKDIHIHVPEGAVPKDGPSAGITISTAIVSALTNRAVKADIAMTGEVTLRGRVLPIGGLKEKTVAAYRKGIKTVIIPKGNEADISELDEAVKKNVDFILAENLWTVLDTALEEPKKIRKRKNVRNVSANEKSVMNGIAQ
ncbi:MAG: endopeptidase La [Clostridiales bacterium]|nr:endopeptidase La [Clostridiales bacterium]